MLEEPSVHQMFQGFYPTHLDSFHQIAFACYHFILSPLVSMLSSLPQYILPLTFKFLDMERKKI